MIHNTRTRKYQAVKSECYITKTKVNYDDNLRPLFFIIPFNSKIMEEKKMIPQQLYLYLEKLNDDCYVRNLGEGMSIAEKSPAREMYLINHITHEAWMIRSFGGTLIQ